MKLQKTVLLTLLVFGFHCCIASSIEKLYSTSFLKNYKAVRTYLKKVGFKKITFKTDDNLTLSGLFLTRPDAQCNVIVCAGWLPGRKEGMATFYDLLADHCNILLFDARGHGESEGSLLWKLWRYGIDEYKDIAGAIEYVSQQNKLPTIVAGICSGGFNAAHAIGHLEKNKLIDFYNVKGLIFDSGWASVVEITATAPIAGIKKRIAACLSQYNSTKKIDKTSYLYTVPCQLAAYFCTFGYSFCARSLVEQYDHLTNLSPKLPLITTPIFFIHSYNDVYAPFSHACELANSVSNKQCWWIEKSSHAKHHLIHKDLYKEKLAIFINEVMQS